MRNWFILAVVLLAASTAAAIRPERSESNDLPRITLSEQSLAAVPSAQSWHPAPIAVASPALAGGKLKQKPKGHAWHRFVNKYGKGRTAKWNPITDTPSLVTGKPIRLPIAEKLSKANIKSTCLDFAAEHYDLLKADPNELKLTHAVKAAGRWHVKFNQTHKGVPVLGGHTNFSFTGDDRLMSFGSNIFPDIKIDTEPNIDENQALNIARQDAFKNAAIERSTSGELTILPRKTPLSIDYKLCWSIDIFQPEIYKKWRYLIDAQAGQIISKSNVLVYQNVTGTAFGDYYPEFATDPLQVATFAHENILAKGDELLIRSWNLDIDPGWDTEGQWQFGPPLGLGAEMLGYPDPNGAYTGQNVYGINLGGDYSPSSGGPWHLTTGAIDCSNHQNIWLKFMRWLNTDYQPYVHAYIQASNDGINWQTVWQNQDETISDQRWTPVEVDISQIAEDQPQVYVRWGHYIWTMALPYSGWNIDDVEIVSYQGGINETVSGLDGSYSLTLPWNRSTLHSNLKGTYCEIDYACGPEASFTEPVIAGQVLDIIWDESVYNEDIESNVYWHTNLVHDYFLQLDPNLADASDSFPNGLNYSMPVTVQAGCESGYCNAYWDGTGMTFGAGDGLICGDFGGYAEVIYHEYTHAVTSKIYDGVPLPYISESGAMNEGWSDYFGALLSSSNNHFIGDGGLILNEPNGFRSMENDFRRETDWYGEVHYDSQMFSAGLWKARKLLGSEIMDPLVHFARYGHPQTFEEYVLAIMLEDDIQYGDSNLANASPHAEIILNSFSEHGIGGLRYTAPSVVIDDASANNNGKLEPGETVNFSLSLINNWADAAWISAKLISDDPFVTIQKDIASFPDATFGGSTNNYADAFVIALSGDCPDTYTINFMLEITADGPYQYRRGCLLTYAVAVGQLVYDDGQIDAYMGWGTAGGRQAVRVTPETYPCYPTHIRILPGSNSVTTLTIWDDDGLDGAPNSVLGSLNVETTAGLEWVDVDISYLGIRIDQNSFYVGWIDRDRPYYNGIDLDPPYHGKVWISRPGSDSWLSFGSINFPVNLMLRVRSSDEPSFVLNPPFDRSWTLGRPLSECIDAQNGESPYINWTAWPLPVTEYSIINLDSSQFAESGTAQGFKADDGSWRYELPFPFPFYGKTYDWVYICSNGFLDFANPVPTYLNSIEAMLYNIRIAPLWQDLVTDTNLIDDIYIDESIPDQVTIRWLATKYLIERKVNFAAVLFSDGRIRFDYGGENIFLNPTIAISSGSGEEASIIPGYDSAKRLTDANSVLLRPIYLGKTPLPPGVGLDPQTGCFNGVPMVSGNYVAMIEASDISSVSRKTSHRFDISSLPPLIFETDFETGLDGFGIDNNFGDAGGLWHLSSSCRCVESGHSMSAALYYGADSSCNYDIGQTEGIVTSPVISLPADADKTILSFNYYLKTQGMPNFYDKATVELSIDGGSFKTVGGNTDGRLIDPSEAWLNARIDLDAPAGSDIRFRFRFKTVNSNSNAYDGFYIDDVQLWSGASSMMQVPLKLTPKMINIKSKGNWIKAHLTMPQDLVEADLDLEAPLLIEPFNISSNHVNTYLSNNGSVELEAAFDHSLVCGSVLGNGTFEATVIGKLANGKYFYGSDSINLKNNITEIKVLDNIQLIESLSEYWLSSNCAFPDWCEDADVDKNSFVDLIDLALSPNQCGIITK